MMLLKSQCFIALTFILFGSPTTNAHHGQNKVVIEEKGKYRYITSNGIPNHQHGQFPNRNNPNAIREQRYRLRVPLNPKANRKSIRLEMGPFGVALNGILFDPGTAEFWRRNPRSGWRYEALSGKINLGLDSSNAHVQPGGQYHYHGLPVGLVTQLTRKGQMTLVGYAADGFPIYSQYGYANPKDTKSGLVKIRSSYQLKKGSRPNGPRGTYDGTFVEDYQYIADAGDLDDCNGRYGITPEYPDGTYHYYITETFPFIPRAFRGTPDKSFARKGPPRGGPPGRRPPPPPRRSPQNRE